MRSLALLLLPAVAFAGKPEKAEPPKPFVYESAELNFRATFPKEPTTSARKLASAAGPLPVSTTKFEAGKDLMLSVTVTTYPEAFAEVAPATLLDGVRDGLKGADGALKADKATTFGDAKHPAREVTVEAGKTVVRARLILVDRKLYEVMVVGAKEKVAAAEAEFLKGFEFLK